MSRPGSPWASSGGAVGDVRVSLDDVLENLRLAPEFTEGLSSAAELAANRKTLYAVVRALEIVGEAAKRVPQETRDRRRTTDRMHCRGLSPRPSDSARFRYRG